MLTGVITDRNGPWLSERLRELGVDAAMIEIVGDRPADLVAALEHMRDAGMALIVTSGGLGPTADDLTAEIVGGFCGREMYLDEPLSERIDAIVRPLMARWPGVDAEAVRAANVKQATVPRGATVLEPVGTAPGLVVPPADGTAGPTVVVLPGPPGELRPMWKTASATAAFEAAVAGAPTYRTAVMRLFGMPESEIAEIAASRRARRAWRSTSSRSRPVCGAARSRSARATSPRPSPTTTGSRRSWPTATASCCSRPTAPRSTNRSAALLADHTIAVAESCTAGLLAARLTDRAGSSAYFLGGGVVYSNAAKIDLARVDPGLIERFGAVSNEVAEALA